MTMTLKPKFKFIHQLDDNIQISAAYNTKAGDEISRTELSEILHPDLHSEFFNNNENITVNGQSHILTEGKLTAFWEWDSEPITESDLDELTEYYNSVSETVEIFKDFDNKKYKATMEYTGENSNWNPITYKYGLKCGKAGFTLDTDNSVIFCIKRTNSVADWNIRQIDLRVGQVYEAEKIGDNICYIIFSQSVDVGGISIPKYSCRNQTSSSITITNISDKPCKIIQIYK
tara:strand:+ start:777 stop:1469 length:693 start_codon:yes stop_codon:yes gene_type:complete